VSDAERLRHDPPMRWIVGGKAAQGSAVVGDDQTISSAMTKRLSYLP
jgi:hypothetical protein